MKPKKKTIPDNWPALIAAGGLNDGAVCFMSGPRGDRLIGSGVASQLLVAAPNVEAAHASVRWNEVGVFLDDLSKEKGTFLNGERFDQSCALGNGDRIWLGPPGHHESVKITVQLPDHPMQFEPAHTPTLEDAPEAASDEAAGEWGAMDDDGDLIPANAAKGGKSAKFSPPPRAAVPPRPARAKARRSFSLPEAPPLSRAVLVGVGAVAMAGGGFLYFRGAQAGGPSLASIRPPKAEIGQTVQILGSGFETRPEGNSVSFGDKTAQVTTAGEAELSVVVPAGLSPDPKIQHKVRVESRGKPSNAIYFQIYAGPRVTGLEPDVAMPGDAVTAAGENFGADMKVSVAGISAEVIDSQPAALRFRVPHLGMPPGKSVPVNVQAGALSARPANLIIGKLPLVLEVTPSRGQAGDRATIKGRGFDPTVGGSHPTFGGRPALILGASATELQVLVPGTGTPAGSVELAVAVRSGGSLSTSAIVFTLTRASSAVFMPRFFAEPGSGPDSVVVASELGPFLRISGKADAASTVERGARVAAALNGILEKASRGPVSIEYREKPEPAVVVAGGDAPVLVATASDASAYAGARPSPRALARFWTALVQDYVALFAVHTRPFRVLELSPRGQAMLDLFVAAERRAGAGAGIPPSLIENLPPAQLRALAEMAISVPGGDSQTASGAAVAGRWDGTFEETGVAPRAIQVRMQTRGAQLSGSLTMRSGAISAELPLENPSYRDGALNFAVTFGARALRFSGKVDGRAVSGAVESKDGKPAGRFSLRWVD